MSDQYPRNSGELQIAVDSTLSKLNSGITEVSSINLTWGTFCQIISPYESAPLGDRLGEAATYLQDVENASNLVGRTMEEASRLAQSIAKVEKANINLKGIDNGITAGFAAANQNKIQAEEIRTQMRPIDVASAENSAMLQGLIDAALAQTIRNNEFIGRMTNGSKLGELYRPTI